MGSNARGSKKPTAPEAKSQPRSGADLPKSPPFQPKVSNPEGRPRTFKTVEELVTLIEEYFVQPKIINEEEIQDVEGLCVYLRTTRKTLMEYEKQIEFRNTIQEAKNRIAHAKKQLAMKGKMPASVFTFDFKNNHGYNDQTETIFPDADGNPQSINPAFNNTERAARMIFLIEQATRRKAKE